MSRTVDESARRGIIFSMMRSTAPIADSLCVSPPPVPPHTLRIPIPSDFVVYCSQHDHAHSCGTIKLKILFIDITTTTKQEMQLYSNLHQIITNFDLDMIANRICDDVIKKTLNCVSSWYFFSLVKISIFFCIIWNNCKKLLLFKMWYCIGRGSVLILRWIQIINASMDALKIALCRIHNIYNHSSA